MDEPVIAAREPIAAELDAERAYFWCTCGKSEKQPFCNGAHKETGMTPLRFQPTESGEAWLCRCKRTSTPPYCDGSHNNL